MEEVTAETHVSISHAYIMVACIDYFGRTCIARVRLSCFRSSQNTTVASSSRIVVNVFQTFYAIWLVCVGAWSEQDDCDLM
jgi:hypothetical protein